MHRSLVTLQTGTAKASGNTRAGDSVLFDTAQDRKLPPFGPFPGPFIKKRASMKLLLAASALAFASLAQAQTVDEILAKNHEAKGGLAKIKAVQSMRVTGKITLGPGMEAPAVIEQMRGDKVRMDITFQGMVLTPMVLNGSSGWKLMPIQGNPNPEALSPEEMKDALEQADMDGFLVDYKSKGHTVEYLGKEKVEGTDAYKLKVTLKSGDVRTVYIDTDSNLEIKLESKSTRRGSSRATRFR